ncbi:unnamed protein product [Closterium sp. Naga37s-1]|nr:unnamed protein product [Closterium sp. Naga37s-1]
MRGDNEDAERPSGHQAGTDGLMQAMEMRLRALEGQLEETRRVLEEAERRRAEEMSIVRGEMLTVRGRLVTVRGELVTLLSKRSSDGTSVLPSQHGREMAALAGTEGSRGMRIGSRSARPCGGGGGQGRYRGGGGKEAPTIMAAAGAGSVVMRSDGNR